MTKLTKLTILTLTLFAQQFAHSQNFACGESCQRFNAEQRGRYNDQIAAQNAAPIERRVPQLVYQTEAPQLYVPKIRCVRDALYEDQITCTQE